MKNEPPDWMILLGRFCWFGLFLVIALHLGRISSKLTQIEESLHTMAYVAAGERIDALDADLDAYKKAGTR